ncbi:MAG: TIR domain-containing protein [Pseudomonadota bacterium]
MISVFISYAREDETIANDLYNFLLQSGFQPWMDKHSLIPGQNWRDELEVAVRSSHAQIFICSTRSVGKRGFFQREIRIALDCALDLLDSDISIIPYLLDSCNVPKALAAFQWVDARKNDAKKQLVRGLGKVAEQRGLLTDKIEKSPIVIEYDEVERDESDRGSISSYSVPVISFPNNPSLSKVVNSVILGGVFGAISRFRSEVIDDPFAIERNIPNEYHSAADASFVDEALVSVVSGTWWYSGGAHPNSFREAINVDVHEGTVFEVSKVFVQTNEILNLLAQHIQRDQEAPLIDPSELPKVLEDSLSSKAHFTPAGLTVMFDPYEVFSYAYGPFEIEVPFGSDVFLSSNLTDLGKRLFAQR